MVSARRSAGPGKYRHRRYHAAPASPHRRRRRASSVLSTCSELSQRFGPKSAQPDVAEDSAVRRIPAESATLEHLFAAHSTIMEEPLARPLPPPRPRVGQSGAEDVGETIERVSDAGAIPPPAASSDELFDKLLETRSSRSASTSSRCIHRLSLTLPIAPPNAQPSRPTPTSSTMGSCPPTPVDTPVLASPTDPSDFITAIAAQERRVLELREELGRAEHELKRLKKQWQHQEVHKKKAEVRRTEPLRPLVPLDMSNSEDDDAVTRRSVELDRRKALLQGQQSSHSTPTQARRRVFHGGHARTLSLLSPAKTTGGFPIHEDQPDQLDDTTEDLDSQFQQLRNAHATTPAQLSKRASWTPRSAHQVIGLKQVAEDLGANLWNFVEDLRQATVGDEPIRGSGVRGFDVATGQGRYAPLGEDQDTIRASGSTARPHVSRAFENTPTPPSRFADPLGLEKSENAGSRHKRRSSRTEAKSAKPYSWAPLGADSLDDGGWSNWESPAAKSPRWSGANRDTEPVPENSSENAATL